MRSLFRETSDSIAFADAAIVRFLPENSRPDQIARALRDIGLARGALNSELIDCLIALHRSHRLNEHLAILSAAEGEVRQLTQDAVDGHRFLASEQLRKVLAEYRAAGEQPQRLRALLEQLFAAIKLSTAARRAWTRLLDYRNWLAHGRIGPPPRDRLPTQAELETELQKALSSFRRVIRGEPPTH